MLFLVRLSQQLPRCHWMPACGGDAGGADGMLGGWRSKEISGDSSSRYAVPVPAHPSQLGREGPGRGESGSLRGPDACREGTVQGERRQPDQVELFQGVARRVSDMLQRPVASYANGREIVITFGQQEAPALALRPPSWPCRGWPASGPGMLPPGPYLLTGVSAESPVSSVYIHRAPFTCARRPAVTVPL